jgi:hypothetical protein
MLVKIPYVANKSPTLSLKYIAAKTRNKTPINIK